MIFTKILLLFSLTSATESVNRIESDSIDQISAYEMVIHDSLFTGNEISLDFSGLKGWKFSPQDDPSFALPDFDDSQWYSLPNTPFETYQLPDSLWRGFGWFRLRIRVDTSFSKHLNIIIPQVMGASELYINGRLVLNHGVPGVKAEEEQLLGSVLNLRNHYEFLPGATYQIAVRYSFHNLIMLQHLSMGRYQSPLLLSVYLTNYETLNQWIYQSQLSTAIFGFAAAILLMVMALHLFMHLSIKDEKANRAILVLSACLFVISLLSISSGFSIQNFWLSILIGSSFQGIFIVLWASLIPWVTHQVLNVPVSAFWKRFVFGPLGLNLFLIFFPQFYGSWIMTLVFLGIILLSIIGSVVAIIQARRLKRNGIGLIAGSLISFPILFIVLQFLFLFGLSPFWNLLFIFATQIIMPVGMSIHQAKQFLKLHLHLDSLVKDRTAELDKSLTELKSTQSQLIQSEKMASLGELTAGIAHEIQNPLNFVNNFSEVSNELIQELKTELETGNRELASEIATDISRNLEKINHHGKRADAIVKGMLQHSRSSAGQKELTDINALCDEYLRLSYHGLRAKDKSFNAKYESDFDSSLPKINVVAQDIGRVILNLMNNAFYAVNEKFILQGSTFQPLVTVTSKNLGEKIEIIVKDNGNGIPENIKEKIFQPFFTTKPTGQGTGLGLSLSYDIVKAHSGELKVETKEGKGTEFIIQLPI